LTEACLAGSLERALARASFIQRTFDEPMEAMNDPSAAKIRKHYFFFLAGLEAHRSAGGNVQPPTIRGGAVEREGAVGFEEMIVAADLDGTVARVLNEHANRPPTVIRLNRTGRFIEQVFSRIHALSPSSPVRSRISA
jgi:hypothetical protein